MQEEQGPLYKVREKGWVADEKVHFSQFLELAKEAAVGILQIFLSKHLSCQDPLKTKHAIVCLHLYHTQTSGQVM